MGIQNAGRFIDPTMNIFKFIGFEFEQTHYWMKLRLILGLLNMAYIIIGQVIFLIRMETDLQEKTVGISFLNYFTVAVGKIISLIYYRKSILEALNEFSQLYPSVELEKAFNLQTYLKQSLLIQNTLKGFFCCTVPFYNSFPLALTVIELLKGDRITYRGALNAWYPFDDHRNWFIYLLTYFQQVSASFEAALIILGLDICLFSALLQLCMHFEIIYRNIQQITPDASDEAEKKLIEQIVYHQRLLRLADKLNTIFTPSVLFSLLSSSFIICFTGYQLLGDISVLTILKAMILLLYEFKQVAITCFLGDKLMETSTKISDAVYEHNWYNGTPKYKRVVLLVLMRSQKSVALSVAGIANVSLQTLRGVMSMSYQIFTVLKTA